MGHKDIVTKEIIKEIARDISTYILGIDIAKQITLVDKEFTRVEKRESDIVFINGQDEIVHIEIQNDNHSLMHLRMLRYYCDIQFEYNHHRIAQYLIYIGKRNCSMKSEIEQKNLFYKYGIIDMRDIDCEEFLYHQNPSVVALSILCDFAEKDKQMVVNTILKRIKELTDHDAIAYKSYLEKVTILSTNRDLEENVKKGATMLAVDIEKIPFYQDGFKDGIQKGIEKGIQKGVDSTLEKVALGMLKLNVEMDVIQKTTGLSLEQIEALKIDR
ncbi:MAG: hypothetical protein K0U38_08495 [Epsilonproteobacteria bacterium]|nr:hypothetical protein [Campylobacterota bacterium]